MFRTARTAVVGLVLCAIGAVLGLAPASAAVPRHQPQGHAPHAAHAPRHHRAAVRTLPARTRGPVRTLPVRVAPVGRQAPPRTLPARTNGPVRLLPVRPRPDLLHVTLNDGHGGVSHRLLSCHPSGRSATAACRRLDALGGPLGTSPRREVCSMLFSGPQTARITGTWRGRRVDETYGRGNGCQTSRWQRMSPVLPSEPNGGTRRPTHA